MKWIFSLQNSHDLSVSEVGGKAKALAQLTGSGVLVPKAICLSTLAYDHFLDTRGLREKLNLELNRKQFSDMRWEEIWDVALRIRHLFLRTSLPADLECEIERCIKIEFNEAPLAIRSSAPEEDLAGTSFAGLHDSYLYISGKEQVVDHIKMVWASLWSDRALLYRQELSLSVKESSMAVVLQEMIAGDVSGVGFTRAPLSEGKMMIEAVYGLNQGLVDGTIAPDRYLIDRLSSVKSVSHDAPDERKQKSVGTEQGTHIVELDTQQKEKAPLNSMQLKELADRMAVLEKFFGYPLDIEWTFAGEKLFILQARPITALATGKSDDKRSWYLSLHRSYENLLQLWDEVENHMLPEMEIEATAMAAVDLRSLDNGALAGEIHYRFERSSHWSRKYWDDCIPFAHGVRLFGEVYNDNMVPDDPYEFVRLLSGGKMLSTERNSELLRLAKIVQNDQGLQHVLENKGADAITDPELKHGLAELEHRFGNFFAGLSEEGMNQRDMIVKILLEYSRLPASPANEKARDCSSLEVRFLERMADSGSGFDGKQLLRLARASYRLRDDDNIYIGKIEQALSQAMVEGRSRLDHADTALALATPDEICRLLVGETVALATAASTTVDNCKETVEYERARQLLGQPASHGFAKGKARVIRKAAEMAEFKAGEVLIVQSIDPNMTFLAPLAAAIVETRGGMLIHGAIIAREYGIPCVTGVSKVLSYVKTGDTVSVDGYLGIVTIDKA